jgi:hypothetical protein
MSEQSTSTEATPESLTQEEQRPVLVPEPTEPIDKPEPVDDPVQKDDPRIPDQYREPEEAPKEYRGEDYTSGPVELPVGEDEMPPLTPEVMPELGPEDTRPDPGDDPEADLERLKEQDLTQEPTRPEPMAVSTVEPEAQAAGAVLATAAPKKQQLRSQGVAMRMPGERRPE